MLLGFQDRFVPAIKRGEKTHTIRDYRQGDRQIAVGDRLDLYKRPRQKGMKLLFRAPCVKIEKIKIEVEEPSYEDRMHMVTSPVLGPPTIWIDDQRLSRDEREQLARRDGFSSFQEMMRFWDGRLPFEGTVIHWDYAQRTKTKNPGRKF